MYVNAVQSSWLDMKKCTKPNCSLCMDKMWKILKTYMENVSK